MYSELVHEGSWIIQTSELELGFSLDTGMLTVLRRIGEKNLLNVGSTGISLDIQTARGWLQEQTFPRYLTHRVAREDAVLVLYLQTGLGAIQVEETYRITGTLIARSVRLIYSGLGEEQVFHVRLALPYVRIGSLNDSLFEAPSNSFRPRLGIQAVAQLRRNELPGRAIAPAIRRQRLFENAPDRGPGLLALHSTSPNDNLLCWYWSTDQSAWPSIHGNNEAVSLEHDIEIAGWLKPHHELAGGTQYILLVHGSWSDAMQAFQRTWPVLGVHVPRDIPAWVREAVIYEVHPALWGGFAGLTQQLPRLQELGFNTINLMPVWRYDNRSGKLWDMNWRASGSPYAIEDFEQFEPSLGSVTEFHHLVETAHQLGLRVICDLVVQGCSRTSPYLKQHPGWFCRDERGKIVSSHGWNDTASFDWANPDVQAFFEGWTTRFVEQYQIDGWRVDAPHRKEPNWDRRLERPASSTSFGVLQIIKRVDQQLRQLRPDGALLCELYGPLFVPDHDFAYDYLAHLMLFHGGLGILSAFELGEWLEDHLYALPQDAIRVCFTETHDTRDVNPIADAVRGSRLARMLLATLVGCGFVPMIWSGQEAEHPAFLQRLFQVRATQRVLREGSIHFNTVPCDDRACLAVVRMLNDEHMVMLVNLGPHRRTITMSLPVDLLNLSDQRYFLYDLLGECQLMEADQSTWECDDLLSLRLTMEPFQVLMVTIRPVQEAPQLPAEADQTAD